MQVALELPDAPTTREQVLSRSRALLWGALALSVVWGACALLGDGFIEADGCTHYLYARFALTQPHYLVDVWGRPLCTGLYALPAALGGRLAAQSMSLALALLCGWTASAIARGQGVRHPALAALFTWGMPLVFLHSLDVLTELPFAAMVGLAFLAYQRRSWGWFALACGLLPLGRPEGFGFVLLGGAALLLHRQWRWGALLALPLVAWNIAGWMLFGRQGPIWGWLIAHWPYAGESLYGRGRLLHFVALLPMLVSPFVFPMTLIGIPLALRGNWRTHPGRARLAIALLPLGVLGVHSLLHWSGKMASNGELRYLLVTAPLWGVLGALGWQWVAERLGWRRPVAWAALAVVAAGWVNWAWRVLPPGLHPDWAEARPIAAWYEQWDQRGDYPRLIATHPALFYFLDLSPTDAERTRLYDRSTVLSVPPGTLFIWDGLYGTFNASSERSITLEEIRAAGWVELDIHELKLPVQARKWHLFHSPPPAFPRSSPDEPRP